MNDKIDKISESIDSNNSLLDSVIFLLKENDVDKIRSYISEIHTADLAEVIQSLDESKREELLIILKDNFDLETLTHLDDSLRDEIIELLAKLSQEELLIVVTHEPELFKNWHVNSFELSQGKLKPMTKLLKC